jgi:hypothetical protein
MGSTIMIYLIEGMPFGRIAEYTEYLFMNSLSMAITNLFSSTFMIIVNSLFYFDYNIGDLKVNLRLLSSIIPIALLSEEYNMNSLSF